MKMMFIVFFPLLISNAIAYENCYRTDLGRGYNGKINITISRKTCQKWGSHTPHPHNLTWLWTEENYCRNPDGKPNGPWCFTMDSSTVWESCGIPRCTSRFDPCLMKPCQHHGTCISYGVSDSPYYRCVCDSMWNGSNCERKVPQCQFQPCKNGGSCMEVKDDFMCHCPSKFVGKTCERRVDLCDTEDGWRHFGNHCYKVFDSPMSWDDASEWCRITQDASLPIINDPTIQSSINHLTLEEKSDLWTGMRYSSGKWYDSKNTEVFITNFYWHRLFKGPRSGNDSCILLKQPDNRTASVHGNWVPLSCQLQKNFACSKPEGLCPGGWFYHQNRCFKHLDDLQTSIKDAKYRCRRLNSSLLEIKSEEDVSFLQLFLDLERTGIGNDGKFWLNLIRDDDSLISPWVWVWDSYGNPQVTFTKFPKNSISLGDCAYMDIDRNGTWFTDKLCSAALSVVCYHTVGSVEWIKNMRKNLRLDSNHGFSECGKGWVEDSRSSCFYFISKLLTWSSAEYECRKRGAHLISIDDAEEQAFITGVLKSIDVDGSVWIGANSRTEGVGFQWTDGDPFVYYNWFPGDPESQLEGDEECVAMFISNSLWTDNSCQQLHSAVCEKMRPSKKKKEPSKISKVKGNCHPGWIPYRDSCFFIKEKATTWDQASALCRQQNAHLASILDQNEQNLVFSQLPRAIPSTSYGYWIGLRDRKGNTFQWEDNRDVTFARWQRNEPQGFTAYKQGCTYISFQKGLWGDEGCDVIRPGYVCRSKKQSNVTNTVSPLSAGCEKDAVGLENLCYYIFDSHKTWDDSESTCLSVGGHLATVDSLHVMAFLDSQLLEKDIRVQIWSGYTKSSNLSRWSSGKTIQKQPLFEFGTNLARRCGTYHPLGHALNITNCDETHSFICEKPREGFNISYPNNTTVSQPKSEQNCSAGWYRHNMSCFKEFLEKLPWTAARRKCRNIGARLTTIEDATSFSFILKTFKSIMKSNWWIGLNSRDMSMSETCSMWSNACATWHWSDNDDDPPFRKWGYGEPNNFMRVERCVVMSKSNGEFNDYQCSAPSPFICEARLGSKILENGESSTYSPEKCDEDGYFLYKDFCYALSDTETSYFSAETRCRTQGAELASIHGHDELDFILSLQKNYDAENDIWIGLKRVTHRGLKRWEWSDKSPVDFVLWKKNEPDNIQLNENCVVMSGFKGLWDDDPCLEENGFICKKRKSPIQLNDSKENKKIKVIEGGCSKNYTSSPFNNKCYIYNSTKLTWKAANESCSSDGGSLLTIQNQLEQDFIVSLMDSALSDVWIGLNRRYRETFMYKDNVSMVYANWKTDQPSNPHYKKYGASQQDCVQMNHLDDNTGIGRWHTKDCYYLKASFICEKPKDTSIETKPLPSECPPMFEQYLKSCFRFEVGPVDQSKAQNICEQRKGNLASITSAYKYGFTRAIAAKQNFTVYWIGLEKTKDAALYRWNDGTPYQFSHWNDSEPSQGPEEECIVSRDGDWMDVPCAEKHSYLCEINFEKKKSIRPAPSCMPTGIAYDGACYFIERKDRSSWKDALQKCRKYGMDLVSIHTVAELEVVREFIVRRAKENVWIGFTNARKESDLFQSGAYWYWSDGEDANFTNWRINEPNAGILSNEEECAEMDQKGLWNDLLCSHKKAFMCKHNGSKIDLKTEVRISTEVPTRRFTQNTLHSRSNAESTTPVGVIVGVVIGLLAVLVLVLAVVFILYRRRHRPFFRQHIGFSNALFQSAHENY
ncbi:macrophage mannose receptor 1-like [Saccostrea echinata]|uniref:macrophage mannose receptor 1-like n=1 Tax=Saccostrea echinata TaxID=191078 RepID=UPI002A816947|nr:macrophage mannose receptor 1-like [Saccostrea echinata]